MYPHCMHLLLAVVFHGFILAEPASNVSEFMPQTVGDVCPGDVLMYNCTINGGGSTIWTGSAFNCETRMNEIILRHSQFEMGSSGNCNGGAVNAQSLGIINNTCYASQLSVTVDLGMNDRTVQCAHSSETISTVGVGTISIATAPPTNVRLSQVRPGKLTFNWRTSSDRLTGLNYTVNSTCGSCPIVTNTTMVTCSGLTLLTTPTMCTFSVRRVACGTLGSPSLPIVVTLAVPDIPDTAIIPQYSQDGEQSLTAIIVRVIQNVTSFAISDTIPGSITSYHIISSGSSIQNKTACMENTCEYTFELPPSFCSTSSVDIAVASANRLGLGPSSEPTTIECNNRFVKVEYDPTTTIISCIFESVSDLSKKSCSIEYGMCGKETNNNNSTTEGSPSTVTLKLSTIATNSKICYVVTASNGTFTVMVKGNFETQSSNNLDVIMILSSVIGAIGILIFLLGLCLLAVVMGVIKNGNGRKRKHAINLAKAPKDDGNYAEIHGFEMVEEDKDCPAEIRLVQFKETVLQRDCKLDDLKSEHGEIIFVDYERHSLKEFVDVMLKDKNGQWFSGSIARDWISQGQIKKGTWKKVFLLPKQREVSLEKNEVILHQDSDQLKKKLQLRVFNVDKKTKLSDFLRQKLDNFEYARAYYEFSDAEMDLLYYREVMEVSNAKLKEATTGKDYVILESSNDARRGIHMFYQLKPRAPGEKVKPPNIKDWRCFVQSVPQDSDRYLKAKSVVLYEENIDTESHR